MESMKKEEAALKAAAKHHDSLAKAVLEYIELTGQKNDDLKQEIDRTCEGCEEVFLRNGDKLDCEYMRQQDNCLIPYSVEHCSSFRVAQEEMLGLLPGYLHPAENVLEEYEIFFGDTGSEFFDIKRPAWMNDDDFLKLPSELSEKIWEYVRDAETCKRNLNKKYKELRENFIAAREAYKKRNNKDESHTRNQRVVEALGLSSGKKGKRPEINHRQAYIRYVRLVRNEGQKREKALEIVAQEFPHNGKDINTARNSLYAELRKVKVWWEAKTYVWLVDDGIKSSEEALEIVRQKFSYKNIEAVREKLHIYEELRKDKRFGRAGLTPPNPKRLKQYWKGLIIYRKT